MATGTPLIKLRDIFALFIGALAVQLIAYGLARSFGASPFKTAMFAGTLNDLCWIGGYRALSDSRGWPSLQTRFVPVGRRVLVASAAGAIALIGFIMAVAEILMALGVKITGTPNGGVSASDLRQLPIAILFIVIIGPFAEELMFRGLLLDWLRQRMAAWQAAVLISLLFASLHSHSFGNGVAGGLALFDRFLLGMATSFLALRYKSLRPAFVLHAVNNGIAALAIALWR
ncbi:MAG TPA: CPBP family intramembrane glutamic endopeptidase [Steroidobacteraceae bacterium]|nr:CPBP family intramembrane glutamic endopeptidase [Steroidobacteraceae bacterium]